MPPYTLVVNQWFDFLFLFCVTFSDSLIWVSSCCLSVWVITFSPYLIFWGSLTIPLILWVLVPITVSSSCLLLLVSITVWSSSLFNWISTSESLICLPPRVSSFWSFDCLLQWNSRSLTVCNLLLSVYPVCSFNIMLFWVLVPNSRLDLFETDAPFTRSLSVTASCNCRLT